MLNLDPAFELIAASRIPDWDQECVGEAVSAAVSKFWEADQAYRVIGVELFGREPVPYKIDLLMQNGHYSVVDWKTKKPGKLDEMWELRERRSPQHKIYA